MLAVVFCVPILVGCVVKPMDASLLVSRCTVGFVDSIILILGVVFRCCLFLLNIQPSNVVIRSSGLMLLWLVSRCCEIINIIFERFNAFIIVVFLGSIMLVYINEFEMLVHRSSRAKPDQYILLYRYKNWYMISPLSHLHRDVEH